MFANIYNVSNYKDERVCGDKVSTLYSDSYYGKLYRNLSYSYVTVLAMVSSY